MLPQVQQMFSVGSMKRQSREIETSIYFIQNFSCRSEFVIEVFEQKSELGTQ